MIHVIATIEVAAGRRADFLAHFHRVVPAVRAEQGCIEYGPAVDEPTNLPAQGPPRENVVVVLEKWDSIEALESHLIAPHMLEYRERVKDLVSKVTLQVLRPA